MASREELPVWARILLSRPVAGDSRSPSAGQPSESSAPAPSEGPDHRRLVSRLDRFFRNQKRRRTLLREAVQ
jgi:hypothetical protein